MIALILLVLIQANVITSSVDLRSRASEFANAAREGVDLPYLSSSFYVKNRFDVRTGSLGGDSTIKQFVDDVKGCAVRNVEDAESGIFVSLDCPKDIVHGGGAVSYNLTFYADGTISNASIQIGRFAVAPVTVSSHHVGDWSK